MKKYLMLFLILTLTACNKGVDIDPPPPVEHEEVAIPEPTYQDDNIVKVGLYQNGKLVTNYHNKFADNKDIANFDVYFTNEENVGSSNTKANFNKYKETYENIDNHKIGFYITFKDTEKEYESVILSPDGTYSLGPYIFVYLYDDINQPDGAWYSHVTSDKYNDNTIFSSIKLYMSSDSNKITTPITLMVFTYNGTDDFDEDGHYRGNSYYTIDINNT